MAETTHIVFGDAGVIELRDALRQLGRDDRVLEYPDDLGFGPIAPADPGIRAQWVAGELGEPSWREIIPHVDAFWARALSDNERHLVWFSRRVTREYCGFLEYLWRIGDRACELVDLTEAFVPVRGADAAIKGTRRALSIGLLDSYQFLDGNLFACAAPLTDETRDDYRALWKRLRAENAPLRIVKEDLRLVSVPLNYYDDVLLKQMQDRFLKAARIIGAALAEKWDQDIIDVGDFFLSRRLLMLARAGVIESKGDLRRITHSEVRLRQTGAARA